MNFNLTEAIQILERTPRTLRAMLTGLSDKWLHSNEGEGTWSPVEVLLHLIEAERTNWIPRLEHLLREGERSVFPPFNRFANLDQPGQRSLDQLLHEFEAARNHNLIRLQELAADESLLEEKGRHPEFGAVRARELIATWTVHDLTHTAQITRILAERYRQDVGPWVAYLGILKRTKGMK